MSGGGTVPVSPESASPWPRTSAAAQWLGPATALRDATISTGLVWFGVLIVALWAGATAFGLTMTAVAMVGAWQAAGVHGGVGVSRQPLRGNQASAAPMLPLSYRPSAAALAGAVGAAGVLDTRLAGAVLGAAVAVSFIVVGALRHRGSDAAATPARHAAPLPVLAGAGLLIRSWMQVGVAAACTAAVARYSLGAALVLVSAAAAYDAAAHLTASGRPPGLRGPLAGSAAAAIVIFAVTGLSVPPFAPPDVIGFGALAVLTLPFGPAIARPNTALATRQGQRPTEESGTKGRSAVGSGASAPFGAQQRARQRMAGEWAVRRLDSLSVSAVAWMWGLGLLAV